jgi:hypothetical protein
MSLEALPYVKEAKPKTHRSLQTLDRLGVARGMDKGCLLMVSRII